MQNGKDKDRLLAKLLRLRDDLQKGVIDNDTYLRRFSEIQEKLESIEHPDRQLREKRITGDINYPIFPTPLWIILIVFAIAILYLTFFSDINTKKQYADYPLDSLYAGPEGRVTILDKPFIVREMSVKCPELTTSDVNIRITALAYYNTTAKIIKKFRGCSECPFDKLSPYDLMFRWGKFADSKYDNACTYFSYNCRMRGIGTRSKEGEMYSFGSNTHIISTDDNIGSMIERIQPMDIAHFEGYLVNVELYGEGVTGGWKGNLDITNSRGVAYSCQVFYVTNVTFEEGSEGWFRFRI